MSDYLIWDEGNKKIIEVLISPTDGSDHQILANKYCVNTHKNDSDRRYGKWVILIQLQGVVITGGIYLFNVFLRNSEHSYF
jgi:hypothetical protein